MRTRIPAFGLMQLLGTMSRAESETAMERLWSDLSGEKGLVGSGCKGNSDYERIRNLALRDIGADVQNAIARGEFSLQDEGMSFCLPRSASVLGVECTAGDVPRKPVLDFATCDMNFEVPCNRYQLQLYFAYAEVFNRAMISSPKYPYASSCKPN